MLVTTEDSIAEVGMVGEAEHAVASGEELDQGAATDAPGNPPSRNAPTSAKEQITNDGEKFRCIPLPTAGVAGSPRMLTVARCGVKKSRKG
jgi:hypothetical protein